MKEQSETLNTKTTTSVKAVQPEIFEDQEVNKDLDKVSTKGMSMQERVALGMKKDAEAAEGKSVTEKQIEPEVKPEVEKESEEKKEEVKEPEVKEEKEKKEEPKEESKPPQWWKKAEKEAWKDVPEAARRAIERRESEQDAHIQRTTQEYKKHLKELEKPVKEFNKLLEQVEPIARIASKEYNTDVKSIDVVKALIDQDEAARKDPLSYIVNFAKSSQIDLQALVEGRYEDAYDSEFHQMQQTKSRQQVQYEQRLEAIERENQQLKQQIQTTSTQMQVAPIQQATNIFFAQKPENEIKLLTPLMESFIDNIYSENPNIDTHQALEQAYEMAKWAHPETRQAIQNAQATTTFKRQADEVNTAKAAQGINSNNTPVGKTTPKFKNMADRVKYGMRLDQG